MTSLNLYTFLKKIPLYDYIVKTAKRIGVKVYLVGGSLRNLLMGKKICDWDFVISGHVFKFGSILADETSSAYVVLDKDFGTVRIVPQKRNVYLDFTAARGSIQEDLKLRDFTINSIALDIEGGELIDPFKGKEDIDNKIIRCLSLDNIKADPLRILRAFRMMTFSSFEIEKTTKKWLTDEKHTLNKVSFERIRDEIFKILKYYNSISIVRSLYKAGILQIILPEILPMSGMTQNSFHKYDVLEHSFAALEELEKLIDFSPFNLFCKEEINAYLNKKTAGLRTRLETIKFAVLLHDVGKPASRKIDYKGILYYYGHHIEGQRIWKDIARRFKLSNNEIKLGADLIKNHLVPILLPLEKNKKIQKEKTYSFFQEAGDSAPGVVLLSWADVEAGKGEALTENLIINHHNFSRNLLMYFFMKHRLASPPCYIKGNEIAEIIGVKDVRKGKLIGKAVDILRKSSAMGDISTKKEAIDFLKKIASNKNKEMQ